CVRVNTEFDCW
nr:immunoglobulin heavy chain junction region [Macaca mulatta]